MSSKCALVMRRRELCLPTLVWNSCRYTVHRLRIASAKDFLIFRILPIYFFTIRLSYPSRRVGWLWQVKPHPPKPRLFGFFKQCNLPIPLYNLVLNSIRVSPSVFPFLELEARGVRSGWLWRRQWFPWSVVIVAIRPSGEQIAQCPNRVKTTV